MSRGSFLRSMEEVSVSLRDALQSLKRAQSQDRNVRILATLDARVHYITYGSSYMNVSCATHEYQCHNFTKNVLAARELNAILKIAEAKRWPIIGEQFTDDQSGYTQVKGYTVLEATGLAPTVNEVEPIMRFLARQVPSTALKRLDEHVASRRNNDLIMFYELASGRY